MIRVGFVISKSSDSWVGGKNYIINLLHAILALPSRRIEPVLIVAPEVSEQSLKDFPEVEIVRDGRVSLTSKTRYCGKVLERVLGRNFILEAVARKYNIQVLSHSERTGKHSRTPVVSWIPDFQHLRLPQFFSAAEAEDRSEMYARQIDGSQLVIVSSHDAATDLSTFRSSGQGKARVLHFVAGFSTASTVTPLADLQRKYNFSEPYFHIPNQYWAHKNHKIVLEALNVLKKQCRPPLVISTGQTADYRHPNFFEDFQKTLNAYDLEENYKILGLIPYEDLSGIFRNAIAIINPSLFEGWSTTVEESKSIGKTIILSDIPVHREQNPPHAHFFAPSSAEELAEKMIFVQDTFDSAISQRNMEGATSELADRLRIFGETYQQIVEEAIRT